MPKRFSYYLTRKFFTFSSSFSSLTTLSVLNKQNSKINKMKKKFTFRPNTKDVFGNGKQTMREKKFKFFNPNPMEWMNWEWWRIFFKDLKTNFKMWNWNFLLNWFEKKKRKHFQDKKKFLGATWFGCFYSLSHHHHHHHDCHIAIKTDHHFQWKKIQLIC